VVPDSREVPEADSQNSAQPPGGEHERFYHTRQRFYTGLLVFLIMGGMPLLVVPPLRDKLLVRVQVLREAANSSGRPAVVAKVGENSAPLPAEYVRQLEPLQRVPQYPNIVYPANRTYYPVPTTQAPPRTEKSPPRRGPEPKITREIPGETSEPAPSQEAETSVSSEPEFRQGKIEQDAFDLLIQTNAGVGGMVRGSDPALKFKNWAAAKMEEDIYYVRLIFVHDNNEVPYIWQVKLLSKQVAPLNFNARSLPQK
jgi:hypothetical protein